MSPLPALLAVAALAQDAPLPSDAPKRDSLMMASEAAAAPSTAAPAAVSASTAAVRTSTASVSASTATAAAADDDDDEDEEEEKPKPRPKPRKPRIPRFFARIESEAEDWEPFSVRRSTSASGSSLLRRAGGKAFREKLAGKARLYSAKETQELVLVLASPGLAEKRMHLEVRFTVEEGFMRSAHVAAVRILSEGKFPDHDYRMLRAAGAEFEEFAPASADLYLRSVELTIAKDAANVGSVRRAEFGDKVLGTASFTYQISGVAAAK